MKLIHLNKNQTSVEVDGKVFFQSYDTIVCTIENGNVTITEGQPQSKTTAKYLNEFLRMHTSFNNYKEIVQP